MIDYEFNMLINQDYSYNKARRTLQHKYHPDKNKKKYATEMSQIINDKYPPSK